MATVDEAGEFKAALDLVARRYTAKRQSFRKLPAVEFGELFAFTEREAEQLTALRDLIVRYVRHQSPARPLCLAVFGPPGSGKSFAVKQIRKVAEGKVTDPKLKLPMTLVNLTQVSESADLGRVIARVAGEQDEDTVPIVFFDEFDAPRNSASYGWLQWFLAPMHDGEFLHEGAVIRLKRAIYVFAGGTADTMHEFSNPRSAASFRAAKGPDFVSRLRGYLDVQGPNAQPRAWRRAILLRNELQNRASQAGHNPIEPDRELLESLLNVGRYRHGARSITAIIELSDFENGRFGWAQLPEDHLLGLHIDRGPLDSKLIGGSVALSGYPSLAEERDATAKAAVEKLAKCWLEVARKLWRQGATLSYAGSWEDGAGGSLTKLLADDLKKLSVEPSKMEKRRHEPAPWLECFVKVDGATSKIDRVISREKRTRYGLKLTTTDYLTAEERKMPKCDAWSMRIIERFRRRLAVSESSVARFAIAGATENHYGRVPGIAEEVMLTLALGKPVYVAGGFGGAALDVGALLGLARFRTGDTPDSLKAQPEEPQLQAITDKLRPGPWTSLPINASQFVDFFKSHAIEGPLWPDNGLSTEDNRRLFESTDAEEVAKLVVRGLRRCFVDAVPPVTSDIDVIA
jgi:hypothetical protein